MGYKSVKYLRRIVVTDEFDDLGKLGLIQNGWSWYAGICAWQSSVAIGVRARIQSAFRSRRVINRAIPMARAARVVAVGVPHHITQRGNHRQDVFVVGEDRRQYLEALAEGGARYGIRKSRVQAATFLAGRPGGDLGDRSHRFRDTFINDRPRGSRFAKDAKVSRLIGELQVGCQKVLPTLISGAHGRVENSGCQQGSFNRPRRFAPRQVVLDRVTEGLEQVAIPPRTHVVSSRPRLRLTLQAASEIPAYRIVTDS